MSGEGSVSRWLGPVQEGDPAAVQELWQRSDAFAAAVRRMWRG
jgi:hypothetical protein